MRRANGRSCHYSGVFHGDDAGVIVGNVCLRPLAQEWAWASTILTADDGGVNSSDGFRDNPHGLLLSYIYK